MNRYLSLIVAASFAVALLATPAFAAKKDKGQRDPVAGLEKKLQKADLPSDVREKATKVLAEQGKKVREAQAASEAILTTEQKSARTAAQKAAKEAGKKRKDAASSVAAALKLSEEQKAKYSAAEKELASAQSALNSALRSVLSADQLAKVGIKNKKKTK